MDSLPREIVEDIAVLRLEAESLALEVVEHLADAPKSLSYRSTVTVRRAMSSNVCEMTYKLEKSPINAGEWEVCTEETVTLLRNVETLLLDALVAQCSCRWDRGTASVGATLTLHGQAMIGKCLLSKPYSISVDYEAHMDREFRKPAAARLVRLFVMNSCA